MNEIGIRKILKEAESRHHFNILWSIWLKFDRNNIRHRFEIWNYFLCRIQLKPSVREVVEHTYAILYIALFCYFAHKKFLELDHFLGPQRRNFPLSILITIVMTPKTDFEENIKSNYFNIVNRKVTFFLTLIWNGDLIIVSLYRYLYLSYYLLWIFFYGITLKKYTL